MNIFFEVRGTPAPKGSAKAFAFKGKDGRPRATVTHDCARTRTWGQTVAAVAQEHAPEAPLEGPVELRLHFHLPRPKSVSKKRRPHHTVKPDLDKLIRAVKDALTGVIYRDDSQVVELYATKAYADAEAPGVFIKIFEQED